MQYRTAGHYLPVALLSGRNIWVKVAVWRNSRREAGCAQRKTRLWARNISCRRRKKLLRAFSSPWAKTKNWGPFFLICRRQFRQKKKLIHVYMCVAWKPHRDWALGTSPMTDYGEWRIWHSKLCFSLFYRLTWAWRRWPRVTPDFGSMSVISSFLLQDSPGNPEIRLLEVRKVFKRSLLLGFQARIRAYIAIFRLRWRGSPGDAPQVCCATRNRRRITN